ncbi:hypothetical protein BR93DRAFT_930591 [Coniochaeta sp. PMI_546]|nr:hypothetical protein BR93DRAFT_930591 [Coniochaeta sp. PMI_546]
MARNFISPYGPRPRHSNLLVAIWMACFVGVIVMTWYISTRHSDKARAITAEFVKGRVVDESGP